MDAFFAAIEERNNPRFKGLPIAVGADPQAGYGRGVLSTANYAARAYGLHSAMPVSKAWRLSQAAQAKGLPAVQFLSGSFSTYKQVSQNIMAIIKQHAPTNEQRGVDEAYFDLSLSNSYDQAATICHRIKQKIMTQEKLTCSVGLGPNKLIAKIASDFHKPDGLTIVLPDQVPKFLDPLFINAIPGIGPKTTVKLNQLGIKTVAELKIYSLEQLTDLMGQWGTSIYHKARGQGSSSFSPAALAKSISHNHTFYQDTLHAQYIIASLLNTCHHLQDRLVKDGFHNFKTITVTVRLADFTTTSRAHTLDAPTKSLSQLKTTSLRLLLPFFDQRDNPHHQPIRMIGLRLSKLSPN